MSTSQNGLWCVECKLLEGRGDVVETAVQG
jgi:hypothetical protein